MQQFLATAVLQLCLVQTNIKNCIHRVVNVLFDDMTVWKTFLQAHNLDIVLYRYNSTNAFESGKSRQQLDLSSYFEAVGGPEKDLCSF